MPSNNSKYLEEFREQTAKYRSRADIARNAIFDINGQKTIKLPCINGQKIVKLPCINGQTFAYPNFKGR